MRTESGRGRRIERTILSVNIEDLDPKAEGFPIVRETHDAEFNTVLSNNFGVGGTNACLEFRKV
jgi:3-oxoacyl-[acyl-carrier-protein] synthase-1